MAALAAHPASVTERSTSGSSDSRLFTLPIRDDVDTAGDTEREILIGYSLVFLQVLEPERGFATLAVPGRERPDLEGRGVEGYDQILVFSLVAPGRQLQRDGPLHGALRLFGGEVLDQVALSGKKED